ncbi:MAG: DUF4416 family protein [Spirochaetes bacterium]|nr:DUF4416 family protein [Spirochaetota bacterium]
MLKVKLFCGILINNLILKDKLIKILQKKFGKIDYISEPYIFNYTDYYNNEMGNQIYRFYVSFEKLIYGFSLGKIKLITNKIEKKFSKNKKRNVNIDPGFISLANLCLATTKNFSHRIPLNQKIYAEVTLIYRNKKFNILPWTYPDYKDEKNFIHFENIRNILKNQLKLKN